MSLEQGREIMRDGLVVGSNGRISREAVDTFGTTAHAIALAGGFAFAEMEFRSLNRFRRLFTPTSTGIDLEKLGNDNHDTPVNGASAAVAVVEFERTDTASVTEITAETILTTPGGIKFRTDEDVTFGFFDPGPKTVNVTSLLFGADQAAEAGQINGFDGQPPQPDMTVTNPVKAAGGNDRESDAEYRAAISRRYTDASKAIASAIEGAALEVPQVRTATVYEIIGVATGKPIGGGELYVADRLGNSNQAMIDLVLEALNEARALGAWVEVFGATPRNESIRVRITWRTGFATPFNRRLVQQAIVAQVNTRRPRASASVTEIADSVKLSPGLIESAARTVNGVEGVVVELPVGEVIPDQGEVIRTSIGLVEVV